jgi:hypothetical protein
MTALTPGRFVFGTDVPNTPARSLVGTGSSGAKLEPD